MSILTENREAHLYDRFTGAAYHWECTFQTLTAFPLQRRRGVYVFAASAGSRNRQCCFIV
ncbi:hypothetical protein KL86DES1_10270 [uncultured Desulfovibrio sp.]|uniref:Uncharacterized protein n=1 Tax=uncultured Desulfovibrio sp. TaxID=167968 RepID=A0A212KY92_9BACT|nr:hypothetical protein KL86DES1_10270 [uncultured Desulfovibrio sp.]VZH32143.1 conserved protein of unknown function [Desulfovibrio sp. 86]